jgi:hypothetical protein
MRWEFDMLIGAFEKYFSEQEVRSYPPAYKFRLWPSEIGRCPRAVAFRLLKFEQTHPLGPLVRMSMSNGVVLEDATFDLLKKDYPDVKGGKEQVRVQTDKWSGKVDFVITWPDAVVLVEHKATNPRWWDYNGELPKRDHVFQLVLYGMLWEELFGKQPELILFYRGWNTLAEFGVFPSGDDLVLVGKIGKIGERYASRSSRILNEVPARRKTLERVYRDIALEEKGGIPSLQMVESWYPEYDARKPKGPCLFRGKPGCPYFGHCWSKAGRPLRSWRERTDWLEEV